MAAGSEAAVDVPVKRKEAWPENNSTLIFSSGPSPDHKPAASPPSKPIKTKQTPPSSVAPPPLVSPPQHCIQGTLRHADFQHNGELVMYWCNIATNTRTEANNQFLKHLMIFSIDQLIVWSIYQKIVTETVSQSSGWRLKSEGSSKYLALLLKMTKLINWLIIYPLLCQQFVCWRWIDSAFWYGYWLCDQFCDRAVSFVFWCFICVFLSFLN